MDPMAHSPTVEYIPISQIIHRSNLIYLAQFKTRIPSNPPFAIPRLGAFPNHLLQRLFQNIKLRNLRWSGWSRNDPSMSRQLQRTIRPIEKQLYLQLPQPISATLQGKHARHPFVLDQRHPHALIDIDEHVNAFETGHCGSYRVEPEVEVAGVALLEIVLALQFGGVAVVGGAGFGHVGLVVAELDVLYLGQAGG